MREVAVEVEDRDHVGMISERGDARARAERFDCRLCVRQLGPQPGQRHFAREPFDAELARAKDVRDSTAAKADIELVTSNAVQRGHVRPWGDGPRGFTMRCRFRPRTNSLSPRFVRSFMTGDVAVRGLGGEGGSERVIGGGRRCVLEH